MIYREEIIQAAAVIVAMIEDLDTGRAWFSDQITVILDDIEYEKMRQNT